MIVIKFVGHENILGIHFNTFEFTADAHLTKKGDCIIGVNSRFDFKGLGKKLKDSRPIRVKGRIIVSLNEQKYADKFEGVLNKKFEPDSKEIVFRKSRFDSSRTLVVECNKSARELDRKLIKALKNPEARGECIINFEIEK